MGLFILICLQRQLFADSIDSELQTLLSQHLVRGELAEAIEPEKELFQLGKYLFFSKTLSGNFDTACASCHHPMLGGGDGLPLSIGVAAKDVDLLGPGRVHAEGDLPVPRNSPTTFNIALYKRGLFWDSRIERLSSLDKPIAIRTPESPFGLPDILAGDSLLAAQARFPVASEDEMGGDSSYSVMCLGDMREEIEERLSQIGDWNEWFRDAFGESGTEYRKVALALAAYQRSQSFTDSPFNRYVKGERGALSDKEKRGALLFYRSRAKGGAACGSCHLGDTFTDEGFWAIAAPQIGRGKRSGFSSTHDFGRYIQTQDKQDLLTFRTPSLLNIEVTAPYTHAGALPTLQSVIRHHLNPKASLKEYDGSEAGTAITEYVAATTAETLRTLTNSKRVISTFQSPQSLSQPEVDDLIAFLRALTDPCVRDRGCLTKWIPAPEDPSPESHTLFAIDKDGRLL